MLAFTGMAHNLLEWPDGPNQQVGIARGRRRYVTVDRILGMGSSGSRHRSIGSVFEFQMTEIHPTCFA